MDGNDLPSCFTPPSTAFFCRVLEKKNGQCVKKAANSLFTMVAVTRTNHTPLPPPRNVNVGRSNFRDYKWGIGSLWELALTRWAKMEVIYIVRKYEATRWFTQHFLPARTFSCPLFHQFAMGEQLDDGVCTLPRTQSVTVHQNASCYILNNSPSTVGEEKIHFWCLYR